MSVFDLILLSIALAMDCFTVSITSGLIQKRLVAKTMILTALLFGLFQGVMPMIGWAGMSLFSDSIQRWDHWIAFGLLLYLGGSMVKSGLGSKKSEECFDPSKFSTMLTMAVATSIDALAIGLTFGCSGYITFGSILLPVAIIALGSFLFSIAGFMTGAFLGRKISFPVEIIGGLILIGIGVKIVIEHLTE